MPSPGTSTSAKASPPRPVICGSQIPRVAAAPMAASAALPPARSRSTATCAARGCEVAHMPLVAWTVERPGI